MADDDLSSEITATFSHWPWRLRLLFRPVICPFEMPDGRYMCVCEIVRQRLFPHRLQPVDVGSSQAQPAVRNKPQDSTIEPAIGMTIRRQTLLSSAMVFDDVCLLRSEPSCLLLSLSSDC